MKKPRVMSQEDARILYNARPGCVHVHDDSRGPMPSGIKCAKCPGWYCA